MYIEDINNKKLLSILSDWQNDFRGSIDLSDFDNEEEFIQLMSNELLPMWIKSSDTQKEDKKLYIEYLKRFKKISYK